MAGTLPTQVRASRRRGAAGGGMRAGLLVVAGEPAPLV